jgi:hypothetical protein
MDRPIRPKQYRVTHEEAFSAVACVGVGASYGNRVPMPFLEFLGPAQSEGTRSKSRN